MTRRDFLFLYILGVLVLMVPARFQGSPGYMDADYYYLGGYNLATGVGFNEQVLWNFLGEPQGLPNSSHSYWMPLTSLVASLGLLWAPAEVGLPVDGFPYGRLGFILIAGLVPPITAWFTVSLGVQRRAGWFAGLLAVFSGFYLSFLPTTDTFGLYMVLGALFLQSAWLLISPPAEPAWLRKAAPLFLGLLAGAMHLARADGLTWLGLALLVPLLRLLYSRRDAKPAGGPEIAASRGFRAILLILVGYLAVMGPWIARNVSLFGTLLSPGGLRTLWLVQYDELFLFPPEMLTFDRWWATGLPAILKTRAAALRTNLGTGLAVQGMVYQAPFVLLGLWGLRHDLRVRLGALAWLVTFAAMTFIFPEPGARGGFFHSGAATQVLFWAAVPTGLEIMVRRVGVLRNWRVDQANTVFQVGFVVLAFGMSVLLVRQRVIGTAGSPVWDASADRYAEIAAALQAQGSAGGEVVLVNNPPGYHLVTGQPAVVIPMGDPDALLAVARRYGGGYLVLESNHPQPLQPLYENPEDVAGLKYLVTVSETHLFSFE